MSKPISKDYLLGQFQNFEENVVAENYVDNETMLAFISTTETALNNKIETITVNGVNQTVANKVVAISIPTATTKTNGLLSAEDKSRLDNLSSGSKHTIKDSSGTSMTARSSLQFAGGVSVSDDGTNDKTVVTLPSMMTSTDMSEIITPLPATTTGGGTGGHVVQNSSGTTMTARGNLQFTGNVNISDDSTNNKTIVSLPNAMASADMSEILSPLPNSSSSFATGLLNFSTSEKAVGLWIHNETLYQKTVETNGNVPSGATLIQRIVQNGYDTILYIKGVN